MRPRKTSKQGTFETNAPDPLVDRGEEDLMPRRRHDSALLAVVLSILVSLFFVHEFRAAVPEPLVSEISDAISRRVQIESDGVRISFIKVRLFADR